MSVPSFVTAQAEAWRETPQSPQRRLLLIGLIILLLMAPLAAINGLVQERHARHDEAVAEVGSKWGNTQALIGPILRVPYRIALEARDSGSSPGREPRIETRYAYFLAQSLRAEAKLRCEERHRGIFVVPVYVADLRLDGHFAAPDVVSLGIDPASVDWNSVDLLLPISDPRAIQADGRLQWGDSELALEPALGGDQAWHMAGIHARLKPSLIPGAPIAAADFSLTLRANGSEHLLLAPAAERTDAHFSSNWPNPSFQANWLPRSSNIEHDGFSADWTISYLGRDYPQAWTSAHDYAEALNRAMFGVTLANPIDDYRMIDRASKYALLIIALSFAVFWLTEVLARRRMHAVQYLMVGAALCLSGLLQLSLSEQVGFAPAFALSTAGITLMVTLYAKAALRSLRHALISGGVLGLLYAYVYTLLNAEDYSLLGGSLALFAALGVVMYLTRRIDWFSLAAVPSPETDPAGARPQAGGVRP